MSVLHEVSVSPTVGSDYGFCDFIKAPIESVIVRSIHKAFSVIHDKLNVQGQNTGDVHIVRGVKVSQGFSH